LFTTALGEIKMFFTARKVTSLSLKVTLIMLLHSTVQAYAAQEKGILEPYELTERMFQHKRQFELNNTPREPLLVTPTSGYLDVTAFDNYDEFVITITNQQGFSKQVKNSSGSVDIYGLDLPYAGKYQYEVLAIKFTGEVISDIMNNGRGLGASTNMAITQKVSGHFMTKNNQILVPQTRIEQHPGKFPSKPEQPPVKRSFFERENNETKMAITQKVSGLFMTKDNQILVPETRIEQHSGKFPSKPEQPLVKRSFFEREK
jgi:hypothetical protein